MITYDFRAIEARWQDRWQAEKTFRTPAPGDPDFDGRKPKIYILDMFPYPSGKGLHVGHPIGYIASDIIARYKRMTGYNVLHPMGFDAFGLPAEQYAVETGTHPRVTTDANIANMRRQLHACGLSYDWDRSVVTTDPGYYRWTQWIFLKLYGSWFDPRVQKARPIGALVAELERDSVRIDPAGVVVSSESNAFANVRPFSSLTPREREACLARVRLAYVANAPVNWCPALGTVLANEEVTSEGRSERGNHPVFKRPLEQWMLRITAYADRLLQDLDGIEWSEAVKLMQRNWIGRSEGARVRFAIEGGRGEIEVFTTRPDTLFGATYMVLAPEHPLVEEIVTPDRRQAVAAYRTKASERSDVDRQAEAKTKTGVFTGGFARNPVTNEAIPVWIADYVLMGYGTGAIMAVPAHDERDAAFAAAFELPVRVVVRPPDAWLRAHAPEGATDDDLAARYLDDPVAFAETFTGEGTSTRSSNAWISLDGRPSAEAKRAMIAGLEARNLGRGEVQTKLRDWLFSRQRYWGEPIPILHGPDGELRPVSEDELPVALPPIDDFRPHGTDDVSAPPQPALARAPEEWKHPVRDGVRYTRELNTMPQWAGSCWYYLRYIDPQNGTELVNREAERYWMAPNGVDVYIGGVEHAVLHLLYARFWHKVLYDLGYVSTPEPFARLLNQGYILAYAYQDARGVYVPAEEVEEPAPGSFVHRGQEVGRSLGKMGKSLKNSVSPDEIFEAYGCDTLRLYEMYMGPVEESKPWSTRAITGVHRFLQRVFRNFVHEETGALLVTEDAPAPELERLLHQTIRDVTESMENIRFNTAIARLIELNNVLVPMPSIPRALAEPFLLMLAPLAPHIAEELWARLGHDRSLAHERWPVANEALLVEATMEIVVQVSGKKRGSVRVAADAQEAAVLGAARSDEGIARHLEGRTIRKVIYVPGKLLSVVAD